LNRLVLVGSSIGLLGCVVVIANGFDPPRFLKIGAGLVVIGLALAVIGSLA
jgi:hypothetical protein